MKKNTRKGFTITELVIVIAVIAILAAVLIPTFTSIINKSKASAALQEVRSAYSEYVAANAVEGTFVTDMIVEHEGFLIQIDNGSCTVVETGTATYEIDSDGALVAKSAG